MEEKRKAKESLKEQQENQMSNGGAARTAKPEKTKEELAELRKQMMKRRPATAKASAEPAETRAPQKKQKEHPKAALMSRLASGTRAEVNKKDMLKLTNKNYENLPEVKKRREEEKKKEEQRKRQQ